MWCCVMISLVSCWISGLEKRASLPTLTGICYYTAETILLSSERMTSHELNRLMETPCKSLNNQALLERYVCMSILHALSKLQNIISYIFFLNFKKFYISQIYTAAFFFCVQAKTLLW